MVKGEDMGQLQGSQNAVWGQARWRISWWSKEPWQQLLRPWSIELLVVLSQVIDNPVLLRVIFDCLVELVLSWAVALAPWVQWPCSNCHCCAGIKKAKTRAARVVQPTFRHANLMLIDLNTLQYQGELWWKWQAVSISSHCRTIPCSVLSRNANSL
jgi:hypothetical protein